MKITKKHVFSFLTLTAVLGLPMLVGAQFNPSQGQAGTGLESTSVYDIITTVLNWGLLIVTVLAVLGFVISGIMFVTAGGSGREADAKKWLTYSIMGIIVALIGYIVINLVDTLLSGNVQN